MHSWRTVFPSAHSSYPTLGAVTAALLALAAVLVLLAVVRFAQARKTRS